MKITLNSDCKKQCCKPDDGFLEESKALHLRGILAICIMLYHVASSIPEIYSVVPYWIITAMAYFPVACFFFISGYGLMARYKEKGKQYIMEFPRNRLLPFYLIICILTVLYILIIVATKYERITLWLILQTLSFGHDTIISKGWYLQVALLCYLCFYLIMRLIKSGKAKLFSGVAVLFCYMVICKLLKFPEYYFLTVPCFLMGCLWNHALAFGYPVPYIVKLLLAIFLFGIVWIGCIALNYNILLLMIAVPLFVIMLFQISEVVPTHKLPLLDFLGSISFEVYVIHGLYIILYREGLKINNTFLYIASTVLSSLVSATLLAPCFSKVYAICRNRHIK